MYLRHKIREVLQGSGGQTFALGAHRRLRRRNERLDCGCYNADSNNSEDTEHRHNIGYEADSMGFFFNRQAHTFETFTESAQ